LVLEGDDQEAIRIGSIIEGVAEPRQGQSAVVAAIYRRRSREGLNCGQGTVDLVFEGIDDLWSCLFLKVMFGGRYICDRTGRQNEVARHGEGVAAARFEFERP